MAERETVVDFTFSYFDLIGMTILMKKAKVEPFLFKFVTVMEGKVWGCIFGAFFVVSFLMFFLDRLSPCSYHNNRERYEDEEIRDFTVRECFWFCMTSVTTQGGGEAPCSLSGKLLAGTWWLFGFIVIASYTANLAAFLTVSRLDSPIESLDDLAVQYKVKYAPQKDTSSMMYFQRMAYIEEKFYEAWKSIVLSDGFNETERAKFAIWDYPVTDKYTRMWETIKRNGMPETFLEGVERVKNSTSTDKFAFIADSRQVKYALKTNCDLVQIGREFSRKSIALAVQKGSKLKDQISRAIRQLRSKGRFGKIGDGTLRNNPLEKQCKDNEREINGISIENIGGVFIIIAIGMCISLTTMVIEYWCKKRKSREQDQMWKSRIVAPIM